MNIIYSNLSFGDLSINHAPGLLSLLDLKAGKVKIIGRGRSCFLLPRHELLNYQIFIKSLPKS